MRTGVSYLGHHNPRYMAADFAMMQALDLDDVLLCAQENDFRHFPAKLEFAADLAQDAGLRPLVIFWGALNLFGGGRSSQFLLEHPECFQVDRHGRMRAEGCYVNPTAVAHLETLVDHCAELGFAGYFVDGPTPLHDCFCAACQAQYEAWYADDLRTASEDGLQRFRLRCVIHYVDTLSTYVKTEHPQLETICCLMPTEQAVWREVAALPHLDNLGTDIYWVNYDHDLRNMAPLLDEMTTLTQVHGKAHHEWLQCFQVQAGREQRIIDIGDELIRARPDALYVWAWEGQVGTTESCADPVRAWAAAVEVIRRAQAV
jgi:hypothetical protein